MIVRRSGRRQIFSDTFFSSFRTPSHRAADYLLKGSKTNRALKTACLDLRDIANFLDRLAKHVHPPDDRTDAVDVLYV